MSEQEFLFQQSGHTGVITFNRPDARNALTFEMYESLATVCNQITDKKLAIRSLIITGAGDRTLPQAPTYQGLATFVHLMMRWHTSARWTGYSVRSNRYPFPPLPPSAARVPGGGAAIAACCDLRVVSNDLKFGFPIARTLGNCLSVGNLSRLVELLGAARTREILLTSRLINSKEALNIGLVNECVEDPLARAHELCEQMQQHAPLTIAASKEGLRRLREYAANVEGDDLIVECYTSEDFREGMDAFLNRRKPDWKGH